jgi:hypothetical protein
MTEKLTDLEIMAFVDGTLDVGEENRVQELLSQDVDARQTARYMRSSNNVLQKLGEMEIETTSSFETEFKAKQAKLTATSTSELSSFSPGIVSKAANSNFLKPLLSLAACLGLVFFISDDIHQFIKEPVNGTVTYNTQSNATSQKTRSTKTLESPIKELTFNPWSGDYMRLKIEIFGKGQTTSAITKPGANDFVIYKEWVKTIAEYFGLSLSDRITITLGERINFSIEAIKAGTVSFQIKSEKSPTILILEDKQIKKGSILNRSFRADPPIDQGRFIFKFSPEAEQAKEFWIPFDLLKK